MDTKFLTAADAGRGNRNRRRHAIPILTPSLTDFNPIPPLRQPLFGFMGAFSHHI
jgi:hypothetical protein